MVDLALQSSRASRDMGMRCVAVVVSLGFCWGTKFGIVCIVDVQHVQGSRLRDCRVALYDSTDPEMLESRIFGIGFRA